MGRLRIMAEDVAERPKTRAELRRSTRKRRRWPTITAVVVLIGAVVAGGAWFIGTRHKASSTTHAAVHRTAARTTTSSNPTTTTQAPGPGFVAGKITAVGDSVMIDYQDDLNALVPGIDFQAEVGRQWSTGEQILSTLRSQDQLGATVLVGLSTNGPITSQDFDTMMSILSGASKVVFVNIHVDQPWQDPNNQVLAEGVARYKNAVLVDWNALANANPGWFGSDGTHIPLSGPAPAAIAAVIAKQLGPS